ncbi:hypothetical protein FB446DRAFT_783951 [Lentinula raphanica]|uniref:ABC transporter TMD0 domain-containing protein n=1 Tax=Lentinula raphanica TaxID=153919 RepID=A0AA38NXX6_9AGAR|nr:hypothetical protein C8R42DRAFT_717513 [Lentinula raphanica]KAJ3777782.1 hypothetical protein FB446DRAFT_783951 [Lentinula raphanica]KAJ3824432.1 hypothetical protein F5880DRAFT_1612000 [Lentinula raphanica]KAJ3832685.1 hypothetical protein F5878DRAFT_666345 [Lentinula raphanica]
MLCSNRVVLPGSPSTCTLDTIIVPLPSFLLVATLLLLSLRSKKSPVAIFRVPYPHWLYNIYLALVFADFAMTILEIARLSAQNLGVGLLPMTSIALLMILGLLWIERRGRKRSSSIVLCSYWLFLAVVETVKAVRLNVLDETIPNKTSSPNYPASDQLLDNAVMVALDYIFFALESYTVIRMRKVDDSRPLYLNELLNK